MKIGVHLSLWDNKGLDILTLIERANKIGFDGVEIDVRKLIYLEDLYSIRKTLKDNTLDCILGVSLDTSTDISNPDETVRNKGIQFLKKSIEIANKLDIKLVTGSTYAALGICPSEGRTKERWLNSVESIKEICRFAKEYNILIGVESINRFRNYLINTIDEALKFIEEVGEPNLVVHADTFHMNIEEKNFYEPIKRAGKKLGYLHANESHRGYLGEGHVDWEGLFKALFEIDYNSWLTIETFPPNIKGLSEYVGAWRRLFDDEDSLAKEGLEFLRHFISRRRMYKV
jgi:D-psicose/D-tagatose/L-ribulose 3-epimerase